MFQFSALIIKEVFSRRAAYKWAPYYLNSYLVIFNSISFLAYKRGNKWCVFETKESSNSRE